MNKLEITGNWNIIKGELKKKWATLTDDDLQFAEGQQDALIGHIQRRTGEQLDFVVATINGFNTAISEKPLTTGK